jgi:hypothetical protein
MVSYKENLGTLFSKPSNGTRVPHCRSLVMHRLVRPCLNQLFAIAIEFADQLWRSAQTRSRCASTAFWRWSRSRKRCSDARITGRVPHSLHRGSIRSTALMSWPHLSHWSPRASTYRHVSTGQTPSTNRSARKLKNVSLVEYQYN